MGGCMDRRMDGFMDEEHQANLRRKNTRQTNSREAKGQVDWRADIRCQKTPTYCKMERLALDDKIEGRKTEDSRARNQSVMQQQQ